jgi:HTH-type transcriptional regulator, quorum sensing regulator NprR
MDGVGKIVKLYRQRNNLSQADLASGICSVSYLSKIENEKIQSSTEILNLLLKRLNYQKNFEETIENTKHLKEQLGKIHFEMFHQPDKTSQLRSNLFDLIEKCNSSLNSELKVHADIILLKYYINQKELDHSHSLIRELCSIYDQMSQENKIFFNLFRSQYFSITSNYEDALTYINMCTEMIESYPVDNWVLGYIYYLSSLNASKCYKTYQCLYDAERALLIFKEEFYLNRSLECYLLMGISYLRLKEYKMALNTFAKCKKLVSQNNNHRLLAKVLHNEALTHEQCGNMETAIELFQECVKIKQAYSDPTLDLSILVWLKTLFRHESIDLCLKGIEENQHKVRDGLKGEMHLLRELCKGKKGMTLDEKFIKSQLGQLDKEKKFKAFSDFAFWFAQYYQSNMQYKTASHYYFQAYQHMGKII